MPLQQADVLFLSDMAKYMKNDGAASNYPHANLLHLLWWSFNPNSGDTGGIVQDDWLTVRPVHKCWWTHQWTKPTRFLCIQHMLPRA